MPTGSPLDLPSVGTAANDFVTPCTVRDPSPARPDPPDVLPGLAVAISGGGFRAALAGMGVLRFLADADLLGRTRWSSSVSGGSITNGLFAHHWDELAAAGFDRATFDDAVLAPLVERITGRSLRGRLLRNVWRIVGPRTRTDLLADAFDDWFFGHRLLEDLPPACRFVLNTANLSTGVRFGFERDVVGDWVAGRLPTRGSGLRLAQAVAASAAVPGAFAAVKLKGLTFPCGEGRAPALVDGGAYDNMGLEPVDDLGDDACLVAVNAGGTFRTGAVRGIPIIRDLKRSNSLLYRQSTGLRMRTMVERFQAWERARAAGTPPPDWARRGVLFGLGTTVEPAPEWAQAHPEVPPWLPGIEPVAWRREMALVETSFNKFPRERCDQLVYRGWWLAGATLATYHRELLPGTLPTWTPIP